MVHDYHLYTSIYYRSPKRVLSAPRMCPDPAVVVADLARAAAPYRPGPDRWLLVEFWMIWDTPSH